MPGTTEPAPGRAVSEQRWPKAVRRFTEEVRQAGFDPVVRGEPAREWTVAVEGRHVRAAAVFGKHGGGPTRYLRGDLAVDGDPRPPVSLEKLREIWDEHELGSAPLKFDAPLEIEDPGDSAVPGPVRDLAKRIEDKSAGQIEVTTGTAGKYWVIGADLGEGNCLRVIFARTGHGWSLATDHPFQVFVRGEDRSAEAGTGLDKALAMLFSAHPADGARAAVPAVRQQQATRSNSVETRRRVVIRQ